MTTAGSVLLGLLLLGFYIFMASRFIRACFDVHAIRKHCERVEQQWEGQWRDPRR